MFTSPKKERIASVEESCTDYSVHNMLPMYKRQGSYSPSLSPVSFRSLETSATIIERSGWRLGKPIRWKPSLNVEDAEEVIKKPFVTDKRLNMDKNRLKLLFVQSSDIDRLYQMTSLIDTAQEYGWINEEFRYFIQEGAAGSVAINSRDTLTLMVQTPRDGSPFFSFAFTRLSASSGSITASPNSGVSSSTGNSVTSSDWVCLFFASADFDPDSIFTRDVFPYDYYKPPRSPDFMALPMWILRWQVEHLRRSLTDLRSAMIAEDEMNMKTTSREQLVLARDQVFYREKTYLMLHRRWLFAKELADTLIRSFDIIATRTSGNCPEVHSEMVKQNVTMQQSMLQTIQHDLDMTPWSIKAQREMIDSQINILIAENSARSAESAREDGSFMKTIALLTMIFLPGNFVATIFSMTVFDWTATGLIVSRDIWIYFAITVPLTVLVLASWAVWLSWSERQYIRAHKVR